MPISPGFRSSVRHVALVALIAGCSLVPAAHAQVAEPARRGADDGLFAAADSVLELAKLERLVVDRNASLASARAAVTAAEARADAERAIAFPELEVGVAPGSFGSDIDLGWRAGASQAIPLFGQRGLKQRAAAAGAGAARGGYEAARLDLILAARTAFYDDYHYAQVHATALATLDRMRLARSAALSRYAAGTAPQQDVLAADVEIAMLEHEAVRAVRNRLLVESRLRELLHVDAGLPLPVPPDTLPLPSLDQARLLLMRSNERTRPEIVGAEAAIESERARVELARREGRPEPRLGVEYDTTMPESQYRWMVTAAIEAPLFGRRAVGREAEAALAGATARLDATRDDLARRISDASTRFEELLHEFDVLSTGLLPAAERSLASARAGYESGRSDFGTLIRAERDVLNARLEFHRTLAGVNQAHADLERALGGPAAAATDGEAR